jgi:micrococcal nuclease
VPVRLTALTLCIISISIAAINACTSTEQSCGPSSGLVERVIDGDTVVLQSGQKIRYLLVNAPETTGGKNECYGDLASQFNADLVLGKTIELRYDTQCTDKYDRLLAYATVDGSDVNRTLVERGYACVLHIPPDGDARAAEFKNLQAAAKLANRGLWSQCSPIPCN